VERADASHQDQGAGHREKKVEGEVAGHDARLLTMGTSVMGIILGDKWHSCLHPTRPLRKQAGFLFALRK
jgi:hypothetical protein